MPGYFESSRVRARCCNCRDKIRTLRAHSLSPALALECFNLPENPIKLLPRPPCHGYARAPNSLSLQSFWERLIQALHRTHPRLCRERKRERERHGKKEEPNKPRGKYCSRNKPDKFSLARESYVRCFLFFFIIYARLGCTVAKCHFYAGASLTQSSQDLRCAFRVSAPA